MSDCTERFMRYVTVFSTSDPNNEEVVPSSKNQFDMANMLAEDLREVGCEDVVVDEHAYVTASFPASEGLEHLPALGLCAHIDTAPDAPGDGVKPHIVHYTGGKLVAGVVDGVEVAADPEMCPYLNNFIDEDIICSDGTTLLSADDKAGCAEIVSLLVNLGQKPEIKHPTLKIAFVPDEEIGHGASLLDLDKFGAKWCYTIDGEEIGEFNYECFNACSVVVKAKGVMVHPGMAKGIMINAITLLHEFDRILPQLDRPEHTEGYEGFFHPNDISGNASEAQMSYIVRDHSAELFEHRQDLLKRAATIINEMYGKKVITLTFKQEYRNMAEKFDDCQFLIDNALEAYKEADVEPNVVAIRGGTDGAQLTFRGLPCPNIATGGCLAHSVNEFIPVRAMDKTVEILENLVQLFAKEQQ